MSHHPVTEHFRIPVAHDDIETQCDPYGNRSIGATQLQIFG